MFPGFAHMYRDEESFVHLYFFSGIDEEGENIYKDIDLSNVPFAYSYIKYNNDMVTDYKFDNKSIVKIKCRLVNKTNGDVEKKILTIKK